MYWIILEAGIGGEPRRISVGEYPEAIRVGVKLMKEKATINARRVAAADVMLSHADKMDYEWRTKDDDGNVVFLGRCGDLTDADADDAFAPLDYSMADCGATALEYRLMGETEWKVL